MTGFGRTGTMLACEHWDVIPDIVALGKGMGAGYAPIAATVVSDRVMEPILDGSKVIMSGHTLSANPQSCAAALAVLEYLENNEVLKEVDSKAIYLKNKLEKLKSQFSFIGDVRGKGLLLGLEFVKLPDTKIPFDRIVKLTDMLVKTGRDKGILLYPAGSGMDGQSGDAVIIAPPLTITKREIDELIALLKLTLTEIYKTLGLAEGNGVE
jgi:adenosylmethionine-8-amino-7-oxononanoate aminotransferase